MSDKRTTILDFNLIGDFVEELLAELNIQKSSAEYSRLANTLEERVTARVFLNIIESLTPEQAALVAKDMSSDKPDTDQIIAKLLDQVPHLQSVVASTLGKVHIEIKNDFKNINQ